MISISKLSMAEKGTVSDIDKIINRLVEVAYVPREQFELSSDKFSKYLYRFTGEYNKSNENQSVEEGINQRSYIEMVVKLVSNYISNNIMYGKLKPGSKLPSEREMAKIFNIKRPVLRDAVKVLTVLGLLDVRQGDGTYVANTTTDFYAIPLSWNLLVGTKSATDIINMRFLIDGEATYLTAQNATKIELMEINNIFLQMQTAFDVLDLQRYLDLDIEFHLAIAKTSKSQVIYNLLVALHQLMRNFSTGGMVYQNDIIHTHEGHKAILNAIFAGDGDVARKVINEHKEEALTRFNRNQKAGF